MPNFPLQNGPWCDLNFPCVCCQKHWVPMFRCPACPKDTVSWYTFFHKLWFAHPFCTLFLTPEPWKEGMLYKLHLQLSIVVSCSLYLDQLGVSVLINIYCKCQHIWWELTDSWIYWFDDSTLEVSLVALPFSRIMVVVRTIWPHQSPDWSLRLI